MALFDGTEGEVVYVVASEVKDVEAAKKHHERARELELKLAEARQHELEHENNGEGGKDVEAAKAHHELVRELEEELYKELDHQRRYHKHEKHAHPRVYAVQVLKEAPEGAVILGASEVGEACGCKGKK